MIKLSSFKRLILRFSGFSLIGVVNTLFSMFLIFLMNEILHFNYLFSYCTAYIVTVVFAYIANAKIVFRKNMEWKDLLRFLATYLSGVVIGSILLYFIKKLYPDWNATCVSYTVVFVTMIWNFFFVNKILSTRETSNGK